MDPDIDYPSLSADYPHYMVLSSSRTRDFIHKGVINLATLVKWALALMY